VPERQKANLLHQRVNATRPGGIPPRRSSGGALPSDRRPDRAEAWTYPVPYPSGGCGTGQETAALMSPATVRSTSGLHSCSANDTGLWPFAVRSISDWKNDYLDICRSCSVRDACGGVFTTSGNRLSQHLRPVP